MDAMHKFLHTSLYALGTVAGALLGSLIIPALTSWTWIHQVLLGIGIGIVSLPVPYLCLHIGRGFHLLRMAKAVLQVVECPPPIRINWLVALIWGGAIGITAITATTGYATVAAGIAIVAVCFGITVYKACRQK